MSGPQVPIAIRNAVNRPTLRPFDLDGMPQTLIKPEAASRRKKIWEFNTNLHCSIIGTCLSSADLRRILNKFDVLSPNCTDHELHGIGVTLAGRHDDAGRQLHKALDHRHKLAVSRFAKAESEDGLLAMWREAVRQGDIPGAYWATLTHPRSNQTVVRAAFGEVHMLSHLVGSANRADIRRLCTLEAEKAALEAKLERQQQALHQAVVSRDNQITALRRALADRVVSSPNDGVPADEAAWRGLVADLERRLAAEAGRRTSLQDRVAAAQASVNRESALRLAAERTYQTLRQELDAVEASLAGTDRPDSSEPSATKRDIRLDGVILLYVGGRPNQVAPMRAMVERLGGLLLHHDGGLENHPSLLPGLASRSDVIVFPVDCISHDAANAIKALCRHGGKRSIPLRSASMTSLAAALRGPSIVVRRDAAD